MSTQQKATVEEVREMTAKPPKRDQGHGDKFKPIRIPANAQATRDGDTIKLVLPVPVSANSYWRSRVVQAAGRKPMAVTYLSAQAKAYKALVKKIGEHCEPFRGPVRLTARVFRARRAGDLGNAEKVTSDALAGVAFIDDAQIVEHHWYQDLDRDNPRVEIEVVALEQVEGLLFDAAPGARRKGHK
ncbi:MAG: RusA family crossover junction endodeoxyribonuclease [Patescibacteria group bacterium]|nr:RusA family crossover junction endodeoxyribonuclease [Patescibacteria group bacterium]